MADEKNDLDTTIDDEETIGDPGAPAPVPYTRFKEINDKLKEAQEEGRKVKESQAHYEARLEALQEKADAREAEWQAWADKVRAGQDEDDEDEPWKRELNEQKQTISRLTEQQTRLEISRLQSEIESKMALAKKDFPNMQDFRVAYEINAAIGTKRGWDQYSQDSDSFIRDIAKRSHQDIQKIKDEAIKEYTTGKKKTAGQGAEGGGGVPPSGFKGNAKSLEEAGKRAAARIVASKD